MVINMNININIVITKCWNNKKSGDLKKQTSEAHLFLELSAGSWVKNHYV